MESQRRVLCRRLRTEFAFGERFTEIKEEDGSGVGSGDGRKNGDCWSAGSSSCALEAEGNFLLAVEDLTLLVLLSYLTWVVDTGRVGSFGILELTLSTDCSCSFF